MITIQLLIYNKIITYVLNVLKNGEKIIYFNTVLLTVSQAVFEIDK